MAPTGLSHFGNSNSAKYTNADTDSKRVHAGRSFSLKAFLSFAGKAYSGAKGLPSLKDKRYLVNSLETNTMTTALFYEKPKEGGDILTWCTRCKMDSLTWLLPCWAVRRARAMQDLPKRAQLPQT
jgi:hypothetical protein